MDESEHGLRRALTFHRDNRPGEAARLYREVLRSDGKNIDALHLFALLRHEQGCHSEAMKLIQQAVEIASDSAVIQNAAGVIYSAAGRVDDAKTCFYAAIGLDQHAKEAYVNLLPLLRKDEQSEQLADLCRRGIHCGVPLGELYRNLAHLLSCQGETNEALNTLLLLSDRGLADENDVVHIVEGFKDFGSINLIVQHFNRLLEQSPNHLVAHQILGSILSGRLTTQHQNMLTAAQRDDVECTANRHLNAALRISPTARCYDLVGRAMLHLGDVHRSIDILQRAIDLDPRFAASYECLGLAKLELGRIAEAKELFARATELGPRMSRAELELAKIDQRPSKTRMDRLTRLLSSPALPARDEIFLRFALAHRLEADGRYDDAIDCFLTANALKSKGVHREVDHAYNAQRLIDVFSDEMFSKCTDDPNALSELPVLIVGMPRSGTTLVEQILDRHSNVFAAGELSTLSYLTGSLQQRLGLSTPYPEIIAQLDATTTAEMTDAYVGELRRRANGNAAPLRITDKMPTNHRHLGMIARLLPAVRVVHVVREPKDVFVSCLRQDLKWPFCDPNSLVFYIGEYQRLMRHWERVLPIRQFNLRYEDLVADPRQWIAKLLQFLDLPWEESCMHASESERAVRTPSAGQVRKPIYTSSIGQWKRYESRLTTYFTKLDAVSKNR